MVILSELIRDTAAEDMNLKRSFSFLSDPVVVDSGLEEILLAILVNLTQPAKLKVNLLDKPAAKRLVQEENWQSFIIKTAGWVHTHNLKYPDSRARGRILFRERLQTGADKRFGWSYNAAWINYAKCLWTEFLFSSRLTSVGEQLSGQVNDNVFCKHLLEWGFPNTTLSQLQEACSLALKPCQPDFVTPYSPQILFPDDRGQYMAITPVVCSETQRRVYNLVKVPEITCRPVFHARPSSVGSHTSACGGKQFCLYYPPRLKRKDQKVGQLIWQWQNKGHLLDLGKNFRTSKN